MNGKISLYIISSKTRYQMSRHYVPIYSQLYAKPSPCWSVYPTVVVYRKISITEEKRPQARTRWELINAPSGFASWGRCWQKPWQMISRWCQALVIVAKMYCIRCGWHRSVVCKSEYFERWTLSSHGTHLTHFAIRAKLEVWLKRQTCLLIRG